MKNKYSIKNLPKFTTVNQAIKKLCGEFIGEGLFRDVYVYKHDPNYVVKIERDMGAGSFANVTEWRNYIDNKEWTQLSDWMAPCVTINQTGQVLIQQRVSWDGKKKKDYPKEIPKFFTDTKYQNFGWIGDKFACCDYSYLLVGPTEKTFLRKTKWFGRL